MTEDNIVHIDGHKYHKIFDGLQITLRSDFFQGDFLRAKDISKVLEKFDIVVKYINNIETKIEFKDKV